MIDLERAFKLDRSDLFLRAEQDMPEELLEDAYKLFWLSISEKKYKVAKFLMCKPYFNPFLSEKPKNWISLICKIPELIEIACDHHICIGRIDSKDALALIKTSLKMRFLRKNGISNFINDFAYESLTHQSKYQAKDLLGHLLYQREWYWSRQLMDWGVPIDEHIIKAWAKSGLGTASRGNSKKSKLVWPHPELEPYKKDILISIYRLGGGFADELVTNSSISGFLLALKIFEKHKEKKKEFLIEISKSCLLNPKSELSDLATKRFPKIVRTIFIPDEKWTKKSLLKRSMLSPIEQLIIFNESDKISKFALSLTDLEGEQCPKSILKKIKSQPKHIATLVLRYKAQEIGLESIVPHISRKEHVDMLLSEDVDPLVLMSLSSKPSHQAYLVERLAEL